MNHLMQLYFHPKVNQFKLNFNAKMNASCPEISQIKRQPSKQALSLYLMQNSKLKPDQVKAMLTARNNQKVRDSKIELLSQSVNAETMVESESEISKETILVMNLHKTKLNIQQMTMKILDLSDVAQVHAERITGYIIQARFDLEEAKPLKK
ncbi:Hypothetical_protein [Hexamita inflata]|uniref:Hypothetical_protein n=1 Tax=Hexamita inflata TaxID=28002 RepID=A0AA86PMI8_9EUKA|nr:Hypothetical protein HINF_LOCUS28978 [Hexamita inflata]